MNSVVKCYCNTFYPNSEQVFTTSFGCKCLFKVNNPKRPWICFYYWIWNSKTVKKTPQVAYQYLTKETRIPLGGKFSFKIINDILVLLLSTLKRLLPTGLQVTVAKLSNKVIYYIKWYIAYFERNTKIQKRTLWRLKIACSIK